MKKELDYYNVGKFYGGSQSWFFDFWMRIGGCGALTACDTCIFLAKYAGMKSLYPFDVEKIRRRDYTRFGMIMKPYIAPRQHGVDKTSIYTEGFEKYMADRGAGVKFESLQGSEPEDAAWEAVKRQIDSGFPVADLTLNHQDKSLKDYVWHWFIINGYEENKERHLKEGAHMVKVANYGEYIWLDFSKLWDTGNPEKGGLVFVRTD